MKLQLRVMAPSQPPYPFDHPGPLVRLGRDPAAELAFADGPASQGVSWNHAQIELTETGGYLTDAGSTNGTFVNGDKVTGAVALKAGDQIRLGTNGPQIQVVAVEGGTAKRPVAKTAGQAAFPFPVPGTPAAPGGSGGTTRRMVVALQGQNRRLLVGLALLAVVAAAGVAGAVWFMGRRVEQAQQQHQELRGEVTKAQEQAALLAKQAEELQKQLAQAGEREAVTSQQVGQLKDALTRLERESKMNPGRAAPPAPPPASNPSPPSSQASPPPGPAVPPAPFPSPAPAPAPAPNDAKLVRLRSFVLGHHVALAVLFRAQKKTFDKGTDYLGKAKQVADLLKVPLPEAPTPGEDQNDNFDKALEYLLDRCGDTTLPALIQTYSLEHGALFRLETLLAVVPLLYSGQDTKSHQFLLRQLNLVAGKTGLPEEAWKPLLTRMEKFEDRKAIIDETDRVEMDVYKRLGGE